MNPLRLSARNYRSFESLDLDFPTGCLAITGENGAGKSSIINLVDLCLFGARSLSEFLSDEAGDEEMMIALEFEHRGDLYRIRRTYSGCGRGKSALDFEQLDGELMDDYVEAWQPLTRETAAATQELLESTIGLSRETFRASAFLGQGQGGLFTEAQPRERKAILCDVLGLGVWDRLLERARSEATTIRDQSSRLSIQIEEAERELERKQEVAEQVVHLGGVIADWTIALAQAEADHKSAADRLNASRETAAALTAAREVLASREREYAAGQKRNRDVMAEIEAAEKLREERDLFVPQAGRLEAIGEEILRAQTAAKDREHRDGLVRERERMLSEAADLNGRALELRAKAAKLDAEPRERCDRCGQELDAVARTRAVASLTEESDSLAATAKGKLDVANEAAVLIATAEALLEQAPSAQRTAELEHDLRLCEGARSTIVKIDARLERMPRLRKERDELLGMLSGMSAAVEIAGQEVAALEADAPSEDLEAAIARAYGVLHEARNDVEGAKQRLAVAQAELKRLEGIETRVASNRGALVDHQGKLDLLHLAERAYGRDGIPALIIENAAIPQIEAEASRILSELGTEFRVELRTQRALKSRDGLAEALDIVVCGPAGERAYETFSGGERTRLNLALRIALARLLAHRRGAEVRMLAIDEPDGLDAAGFAALSQILQGMSGDFDSILVISHHPDLATAFDQTLSVEKVDGRSRVVGAEVAEAVAA